MRIFVLVLVLGMLVSCADETKQEALGKQSAPEVVAAEQLDNAVVSAVEEEVEVSSEILSEEETNSIFTSAIREKLGISYSIYRTYSYSDRSGSYYMVLSERSYKEDDGDQPYNDSIKAFNIKVQDGELVTQWSLRDFLATGEDPESNIWLWTKYCLVEDVDDDGLIDPIIIYGTWGPNRFDDGHLKILIYHKGRKRAIRHQNSVSDYGRSTQIDKTFYELPPEIQARTIEIMHTIEDNGHSLFQGKQLSVMETELEHADGH